MVGLLTCHGCGEYLLNSEEIAAEKCTVCQYKSDMDEILLRLANQPMTGCETRQHKSKNQNARS
jgi:hypothetical protein